MKILILALSGIGDALMFTPALQRLKEYSPEAEIDALVMYKGVKNFYENLPQIDKLHYFDFLNESPFKALSFVLGLRKKYDVSISVYPSNRKEYNGINFLIGAKKRCGVKYNKLGFSNFYFLNNLLIDENPRQHNVVHNIKMADKIFNQTTSVFPDLHFPLTSEAVGFANEFSEKHNLQNHTPVIGFHAGCSTLKNHINRRWSPEKFAGLADKLISKLNAKILLFGGPDEKELKNNILSYINSDNAVNVETGSLNETAAIINLCSAFVTNDSGLMHIAAAMKRKTVAIIGPTNKAFIHPWNTEHKIVSTELDCAPCFFYSPEPLQCSRTDQKFKCLKELSVETVFEEVVQILNL